MQQRHHRVALLDEQRGAVLVVPDGEGGWRLPRHPERWADHPDLVAAAGAAAATAYLEVPPHREEDGTITNVLVGDGTSALPDAEWWPLADLGGAGVSEAALARVTALLAERAALRAGAPLPDDGRPSWYLPGWRDDVEAWVDAVGEEHGFARRGAPEAMKIWMLSAVLRFPVERDGKPADLWFKATCEGFRTEPALTRAVAGLAPDLVPTIVGVDAARAWLLMEPLPADQDARPDRAPAVARALARLQLDARGANAALLLSGAPDRGLTGTLAGLRACIHDSVEADAMGEELRHEAAESEEWLADRLRELWAWGLPDTLSHGDLHLGNVAWDGERPVFYDWTDTCLTHPFFDARHLADSAADECADDADKEAARAAVWEAYAEAWRAAYPDLDLDAVWAQVRLAEAVFQMISYENIARAQTPDTRWELSGVVTRTLATLCRMRREALAG
ncbi:phosphotransferase family protein [Nocardioides taihuensis]|uniref:Phosphotransferase family protein n=1 Tax=Nocardioides taihuensis TaxID=1835606 RepID=A0ABW0BIW2_9ACTN